jgi:phosphate butyryltransferase
MQQPFRSFAQLIEAAKQLGRQRIAVAVGQDPDVIESLKIAGEMELADGIFVGDAGKIRNMADKVGLEIPASKLINETDPTSCAQKAIDLVRNGKADLLMKGKVSTATLIKAVLDREQGLRTARHLSQVVVFEVPGFNRLMIMSDAAINIAPTLAQKAEIARNCIEVAHAIGIAEPKVVALCALEFVNPDMPATVDAAALTLMNRRGQITGGYIEGPLALDVPLSEFAADRKNIKSPVVADTDIFLHPNIEAANIFYRAVIYFAKGESGGVIVGAKVPIILLSRAESPQTKIHSIAIAALVAKGAKQEI